MIATVPVDRLTTSDMLPCEVERAHDVEYATSLTSSATAQKCNRARSDQDRCTTATIFLHENKFTHHENPLVAPLPDNGAICKPAPTMGNRIKRKSHQLARYHTCERLAAEPRRAAPMHGTADNANPQVPNARVEAIMHGWTKPLITQAKPNSRYNMQLAGEA